MAAAAGREAEAAWAAEAEARVELAAAKVRAGEAVSFWVELCLGGGGGKAVGTRGSDGASWNGTRVLILDATPTFRNGCIGGWCFHVVRGEERALEEALVGGMLGEGACCGGMIRVGSLLWLDDTGGVPHQGWARTAP
eukprot:scaffold13190_cov73-Isochrysis_galbana.AAC.1